jgi:hypothetical protein
MKNVNFEVKKTGDNFDAFFSKTAKAGAAVFAAFKSVEGILKGVGTVMASTQTTGDLFVQTTEGLNAGMEEFYRIIASGDWSNFFSNITKAIQLEAEFQTALDNYQTRQLRGKLVYSEYEKQISEKQFERSKTTKDSEQYNKLTIEINELNQKVLDYLKGESKLAKEAAEKALKQALPTMKSGTEGENMQVIFDIFSSEEKTAQLEKNASLYALQKELDNIAHLDDKRNTFDNPFTNIEAFINAVGKDYVQILKDLGIRDKAHLDEVVEKMRNSDLIIENSADRIIEHKDDLKRPIELMSEANNKQSQVYKSMIKEQQKETNMLNKAGKNAVEYEPVDLEAYQKQLEEDFDKQIKSDEISIDVRIKSNIEKFREDLKKDLSKSSIDFSEFDFINPYVSKEEIDDHASKMRTKAFLEEAIAINTLSGNLERVNELQSMYDEQFKPDKIITFSDAIGGLSSALDILSSSSSAIKDNPAIKALAGSLMILNAIQQVGKATSWIEYVIALASVAAATISFATSMSSADSKYAVGGLVAPAKGGDQTNIRVNEGEMILNKNQQTRLFNIISRNENEKKSGAQVEFKLRGTELVGLINNYNRKYSN